MAAAHPCTPYPKYPFWTTPRPFAQASPPRRRSTEHSTQVITFLIPLSVLKRGWSIFYTKTSFLPQSAEIYLTAFHWKPSIGTRKTTTRQQLLDTLDFFIGRAAEAFDLYWDLLMCVKRLSLQAWDDPHLKKRLFAEGEAKAERMWNIGCLREPLAETFNRELKLLHTLSLRGISAFPKEWTPYQVEITFESLYGIVHPTALPSYKHGDMLYILPAYPSSTAYNGKVPAVVDEVSDWLFRVVSFIEQHKDQVAEWGGMEVEAQADIAAAKRLLERLEGMDRSPLVARGERWIGGWDKEYD